MRRIVLWFLSTASVVALLFGYHTSTSGPAAATGTVIAAPVTPTTGASTTGTGTTGTGTTGTSTSGTVTGAVADTRWGPVQVQLAVSGGKITGVTVLQYPDGNGRDEEINSRALPILTQATIDAQSANIDMVSGATVTSSGYLQSLQSALDQAGLT